MNWRHDWILVIGASVTLLFGMASGITLGLGSLLPFLTGFLVAFVVALGIIRSVGQRGMEKRAAEQEKELEGMKSDLEGLLSRLTQDDKPHRVPLTVEGIKKNLQAYLREGETRSKEEREESKLLAHRPDCETPWKETDCECEPLVLSYEDVLAQGPEATAKLIYARMKDEQSLN